MDKRAWYKNTKGFFYILVLFQTVVILFTAIYVVLFVRNTQNGKSVGLDYGYRRYYDLNSKNKRRRNEEKAFRILVKAKGKIIDNHKGGNGKTIALNWRNESNMKIYRRKDKEKINKNNGDNSRNNRNVSNSKKHINMKRKKTSKSKNKNNRYTSKISSKSSNNNDNKNNDNKNKNKNNNNIHGQTNNIHPTSLTEPTLPNQRKSILMFIAIMSAPVRIHRRNALRRSWLQQCQNYNTSCYIFTDGLDMHGKRLPDQILVTLEQERFLHKDLIIAESPGGINFARRYLWIINWANKRYKFDFLLRVDDDYFICMDRLFLELPQRRKISKLYWGHVHCYPPGGIRVDEGFVIVSNDLIQHFIKEQYNSLMCHAFGDQAMAMWINDIENVTYFGDPRVHYEVTANEPILEQHLHICGDFLALHGSYPIQIEQYWQAMLLSAWQRYPVPGITYPCGDQDKKYNHTNFEGMYYAAPIPCKDSPVWNIGDIYVGRSGFLMF